MRLCGNVELNALYISYTSLQPYIPTPPHTKDTLPTLVERPALVLVVTTIESATTPTPPRSRLQASISSGDQV